MKLFSTGPDPRIGRGFLPPPEPREFSVRSSALVQLGLPRCSVSPRQSHELKTCSSPTKLGTCRPSITNSDMCKTRLQLYCQDTFLNHVRELHEFVRSCSCDDLPKLLSTNKLHGQMKVNSKFIVENVMCATENLKKIKKSTTKWSNIRVKFLQSQLFASGHTFSRCGTVSQWQSH